MSVFVNIRVGDSGEQGRTRHTQPLAAVRGLACMWPLSTYEGQCPGDHSRLQPPWHGGEAADSAPPLEMEAVQ